MYSDQQHSDRGLTCVEMRSLAQVCVLLLAVQLYQVRGDTEEAWEFLQADDEQRGEAYYASVIKAWAYNTNITNSNRNAMVEANLAEAAFSNAAGKNASTFDWKNFQNETMRRWFSKVADIGTAAMPDKAKLERLNNVLSEMEETYSTGKVCITNDNCLELSPGLTRLLATSRDYEELTKAWKGWRDATGKKMKNKYEEFVELSNEAIRANGFNDTGEYWRSWYESPTFQEDVEALFLQLEPLYKQLHAYTRRKLVQLYGEDKFPKEGHIPAHLLGNMWAQSWSNLLDILQPYKDKESVDVTPQMKEQNYTALKMFNVSEEFFTSLGLIGMPQEFWDHSMIEKPKDGRDVVCHASAWDFYNQKDFRIKQCTDITMEDLITVHHEMGHIEYFLQYKNQPVVFRDGANPGFHEAVGDVLALSVATPKHLQQIGLLSNVQEDTESDINYMLSIALDKIAFLPFGYLMDQWRWSVFSGETSKQRYNTKWWELRCRYQGIAPPLKRSEEDFDPGAKFHIPANTPYIRYFVSFVIQFQFHKALCQAAGETGPLHKCDIYRSTAAGDILSIKQCTDVTMEDLITVHHEMGHVEYYLQYKHLPVVFRRGANPGFHEAVGDVLALSVATPKHLQEIGLLSNVQEDTESDINYMLSIALDKIAFLPFGYLMDQWRWSVFSGETSKQRYNTKWWELRCRYQGISPPVKRSEEDFDPGAKYHIPANTPYIRYFVSFVIQFQFHKALCEAAGETGPLHKCDIYTSKEAGTLLSRVLELGSSRPWPEAMKIITGQGKMDAGPLMEYFKPLTDWLTEQNEGHKIGWEQECPDIPAELSSALQISMSLWTVVFMLLVQKLS